MTYTAKQYLPAGHTPGIWDFGPQSQKQNLLKRSPFASVSGLHNPKTLYNGRPLRSGP